MSLKDPTVVFYILSKFKWIIILGNALELHMPSEQIRKFIPCTCTGVTWASNYSIIKYLKSTSNAVLKEFYWIEKFINQIKPFYSLTDIEVYILVPIVHELFYFNTFNYCCCQKIYSIFICSWWMTWYLIYVIYF